MTEPINQYFTMAQLALASYVDFGSLLGTPEDPRISSASEVRDAILGRFPGPLANAFSGVTDSSQGFRVLSQRTDPGGLFSTGFSATLFRNRQTGEKILAIRGVEPTTTADLITSVNIALIGQRGFSFQYNALKQYYQQLISQNLLGANEQFSIAGHSLGGWLGASFATDAIFRNAQGQDRNIIQNVYTYNAPGYNGAFGQLLAALGVASPVVNTTVASKVTNLIAQGTSLIAGFGQLIGPPNPTGVFIENNRAVHDHSINTLTDALAVYDLFTRMDQEASLSSITDILKAMSNVATDSLGQSIKSLYQLFLNQPAAIASSEPAHRVDLYERLFELRALPELNGTLGLSSLVRLSATDVADFAKNTGAVGTAVRYALTELNPFAITGVDYTLHDANHELDLATEGGTLTNDYLADRAKFLKAVIAVNLADNTLSARLQLSPAEFKDVATGLDIAPARGARQDIFFGGSGSDVLTGGAADDHCMAGAVAMRYQGAPATICLKAMPALIC